MPAAWIGTIFTTAFYALSTLALLVLIEPTSVSELHGLADGGNVAASVLRGHFAYYAVPGNDAPSSFLYQVRRLWFRALRRRSQRHRLTWERMGRIATRWLPPARGLHPYPEVRFAATYPR